MAKVFPACRRPVMAENGRHHRRLLKIQNTKYKIQNTTKYNKYKTQNTKYKIQSAQLWLRMVAPQTTPHHDGLPPPLFTSPFLSLAMLVKQTVNTKKGQLGGSQLNINLNYLHRKVGCIIITYSKVCGAGDGKVGSQLNVGLMLTAKTACFPAQ